MAENKHDGHRERLKNRFEKEGLRKFEPHNVLEMALFYVIPRKDTNEIAHDLIDRFGSFSEVLDAPVYELEKVNGIGHNAAVFISFLKEIHSYYQDDKVNGGEYYGREEISEYIFARLSCLTEEHVMVVCVDNTMKMICADIICKGSVNSTAFSIREIVNCALRHNAVAIILAHNHPRGYPLPSRDDLDTTKAVRDALASVSVALLDHIICSPKEKSSLASVEQLHYLFK